MKDSAVKRWSAFHAFLYRTTAGTLGRRLVNNDMLLLTTRGHKTRQDHTVPLLYLRSGPTLVVIASYGGRPEHPVWFENLVADPEVRVQVRSNVSTMVARTAAAEERARWWPRIVAAYDGYATYQSRTDREIPVVLLDPVEDAEHQTG